MLVVFVGLLFLLMVRISYLLLMIVILNSGILKPVNVLVTIPAEQSHSKQFGHQLI